MKTKIIVIGLLAGILSLGQNIGAASPARSATFTQRHRAVAPQPTPLLFRPEVSGVIPRAIRGGHPFEILNPFAPPKYGTTEQSVVLDPDMPGKADGIKLLSFSF
jgi:hypothetical protein